MTRATYTTSPLVQEPLMVVSMIFVEGGNTTVIKPFSYNRTNVSNPGVSRFSQVINIDNNGDGNPDNTSSVFADAAYPLFNCFENHGGFGGGFLCNYLIPHCNLCITKNEITLYLTGLSISSETNTDGYFPKQVYKFYNFFNRDDGRFGFGTGDLLGNRMYFGSGCFSGEALRQYTATFANSSGKYGSQPVTKESINKDCHPCGLKMTSTVDTDYFDEKCDCQCCNTCDNVCENGVLPESIEVFFPSDTFNAGYGNLHTNCCLQQVTNDGTDLNGATVVLTLEEGEREKSHIDRNWIQTFNNYLYPNNGTSNMSTNNISNNNTTLDLITYSNCMYVKKLPNITISFTNRTDRDLNPPAPPNTPPYVRASGPPEYPCNPGTWPCQLSFQYWSCPFLEIPQLFNWFGEIYNSACEYVYPPVTLERFLIAYIADPWGKKCGDQYSKINPTNRILTVKLLTRFLDYNGNGISFQSFYGINYSKLYGTWENINIGSGTCSGTYILPVTIAGPNIAIRDNWTPQFGWQGTNQSYINSPSSISIIL